MANVCFGWSWLDAVDSILFLLSIYIGIYVGYKGIKGTANNKTITKFFKLSYFGMIIVYLIASYGLFMDVILYNIATNLTNNTEYTNKYQTLAIIRNISHIITFISYYALLISLFLILITRLIYTFKDSVYALNKHISNAFYYLTIFTVFATLVGFMTNNALIAAILQTFSILLYLIICCAILTLFLEKLNLSILTINGVSKIKNGHTGSHSIQSKEIQIDIIKHASKYLILSFSSFVTTFVVMFTHFMIGIASDSKATHCITHRICVVWLLKVNLIINILCFYLQFSFSTKDYVKNCSFCDAILKRNIRDTNNIKSDINITKTMANDATNNSNSMIAPTPSSGSVQIIIPIRASIDISLDKIDFDGNIIGKRGKNNPKKYSKDEIVWNVDLCAVNTEKITCVQPKEKPLFKKSDLSRTPTLISMSRYGMDNTDMEHMHLSLPVNTIVFEFGNVLCTQIEVLENKMSTFLKTKDKLSKQMYFGGVERLQMLREWFGEIYNGNRLCFVISSEQSKMVVNLLSNVELLRYFVRVHPSDEKKLLSHIFGYDHRVSDETESKRHLMLLKLLQSLNRKHEQLLYIGSDLEIISHLQSIQLCKTYHVETKGLLKSDLVEIQALHL